MSPSRPTPTSRFGCFWPARAAAGDLSRFIEEAVRAHILELSAEQAKAANAHLSEAELTNAVDEALDWARKR